MASSSNKQVSTAIALIAIGSFLLMMKLDVIDVPWYVFTWQFLLIGIGFLMIVTRNKWEGGVVLMTVGGAFLLPRITDITMREVFQYWPVLLIIIGVIMLVRYLEQPKIDNTNHFNQDNHGQQQ